MNFLLVLVSIDLGHVRTLWLTWQGYSFRLSDTNSLIVYLFLASTTPTISSWETGRLTDRQHGRGWGKHRVSSPFARKEAVPTELIRRLSVQRHTHTSTSLTEVNQQLFRHSLLKTWERSEHRKKTKLWTIPIVITFHCPPPKLSHDISTDDMIYTDILFGVQRSPKNTLRFLFLRILLHRVEH